MHYQQECMWQSGVPGREPHQEACDLFVLPLGCQLGGAWLGCLHCQVSSLSPLCLISRLRWASWDGVDILFPKTLSPCGSGILWWLLPDLIIMPWLPYKGFLMPAFLLHLLIGILDALLKWVNLHARVGAEMWVLFLKCSPLGKQFSSKYHEQK